MAGNNSFQFKQFKIVQEKSAMRVGTDGVLLGAWANVSGAEKILDVGAGTGIIALMLAQRSAAEVTGIEIEKEAAAEAARNAWNSPWHDRVKIIQTSLQEFVKESNGQFDLIVSNPPFYINDKRSENGNLSIARHSDKLPLHDLAKAAEKLLNQNGKLALILPVFSAEKFIKLAATYNLNLSVLTEIKPAADKPALRYLMEFCKAKVPVQRTVLSIRNAANDDFTEEYKTLTRDFYLKF